MESQIWRDLRDHMVQSFLEKVQTGQEGAGGHGCQVLEKGWQGTVTPLSSTKRHFGVWAGVLCWACELQEGRSGARAQWLIK